MNVFKPTLEMNVSNLNFVHFTKAASEVESVLPRACLAVLARASMALCSQVRHQGLA
jgi:hypothetical protein